MSILARVSSNEVTQQVTDRFVGKYCEARLINSPGTTYTPGTTDNAIFLASEVAHGTAGYEPRVLYIEAGDITGYNDGGVGVQQKATVFAHDGGTTALDFTHVALVWTEGNVVTIGSPSSFPASATDGTYTNIPVDSTSGSGSGLTVDITITNSGASGSDYVVTPNYPGRDYSVSDTATITNATLASIMTVGTGDLVFPVSATSSNTDAGEIIAVAKTSSSVSLTAGNEAAFFWNIKLFGYFQ